MNFRLESLINFNTPKPTGYRDNQRIRPDLIEYQESTVTALDFRIANAIIERLGKGFFKDEC